VSSSTFSDNSSGRGGGIENFGANGGNASLKISACTFSGNSATNFGGAIRNVSDSQSATVEIGDTILNAGTAGANIANYSGVVTSVGFNLSSDDGGGLLTATGDRVNTDPLLSPLQNNGGPTFTHSPRAGSPAIDTGKRNTIAVLASDTDQRGSLRPVDFPQVDNPAAGDGSDIGAVEVQTLSANPCPELAGRGSKLIRLCKKLPRD